MHISQMQEPEIMDANLKGLQVLSRCLPPTSRTRTHRSRSLDLAEDCRTKDFLERMKRTHEYRLKGFKGNMRGPHIHGPFTTLEEMLAKIPENVGIDIELSEKLSCHL